MNLDVFAAACAPATGAEFMERLDSILAARAAAEIALVEAHDAKRAADRRLRSAQTEFDESERALRSLFWFMRKPEGS